MRCADPLSDTSVFVRLPIAGLSISAPPPPAPGGPL